MEKIIVLDNVDIVTYSAAVNEIAKKFFDEDDNYTPQFGRANAVGVFFNRFVDIVSLEAYFADYDGEINIDLFLADENCLNVYNEALKNGAGYRLNFANAYADAMDIVKTKNTTIGGAVELFRSAISKIADKINPIFTDENIAKLEKISADVAKGDLSADSVVKALGDKHFK
jgi:beta-mannanase